MATTWLQSVLVGPFAGTQRYKDAVRVAHDASNITLSGEQTIQSVSLLAGDSIALYGQTNPAENGLWTVAAGGWARRSDAGDVGDLEAGVMVYVAEGTYAGGLLTLTTTGTIYPGVTSQTWQMYTPAVVYGGAGSLSQIDPGDAASAGVAGTAARIDHQHAVNSATAATSSTLVARDGSGGSAFGWLSVGSSPAASGDLRVPTTFVVKSGAGADYMAGATATDWNFGSISRDTNIEGLELSIYSDSSGASITSTAGGELDIQVPAGIFQVNASGALSCVGGAASTFGCTAGDLTLGAAADTAKATMSAGTAGNAVAVEANANTDAITCTVNGTAALALSTTAATLGVPAVKWGESVAAPTIQQAQRASNAAARGITLASQAPYASATGTNRDAQPITLDVPAPASGGAESYVSFKISGTERAQIGRYAAIFNDGNSAKPVRIGAYVNGGSPSLGYAAIYFGSNATSPTSTNYGFLGDNTDTYLNSNGVLYYMKSGEIHSTMTVSGSAYSYTLGPTTSLVVTADSAAASITANKAQALTVSIGTQTADSVSPKDLTLTPGQPYTSATGVYRKPGDLVVALGAPTNGGTTHAQRRTTRGASSTVIEDKGEVTTTDATATVVYTYTLADTTAVHLRARMVSFRTDSGTNCNVNVLEAGAKRRGGGATLVGTPTTVLKEDAGFTSFTATVSGNDLRVEVQARGAETWKHRVHVEIVAEVIT